MCPKFDLTRETSELVIEPFTLTSSRKLDASAVCPTSCLVRLTSAESTEPEPSGIVSPIRTPIWTVTLYRLVLMPSFTSNNLMVIVCTSLTLVRFTVTCVLSELIIGGPASLPDPPAPGVTVAPLNVTKAVGKVNTT